MADRRGTESPPYRGGGRRLPHIPDRAIPSQAEPFSRVARGKVPLSRYHILSGPRTRETAAGSEAIYDVIGFRESADAIVGVLETRKLPHKCASHYANGSQQVNV